MTVMRIGTTEHVLPRRQSTYHVTSRRGDYSVFLSRPERGYLPARRGVIAEKRRPQRAFSAEGLRWDLQAITIALVVLLILCVLAADISALCAGGNRIGRLSAGITSLEQSNDMLREEISRAQTRLFTAPDGGGGTPERTVLLSPAPEP